jgi:glycosyltransferase involved in cell wall biosynthesis
LTPAGKVPELASALEGLVTNRDLAEEMGANARRRALERFSEERCVSNLMSIYSRVSAEHAARLARVKPEPVT